MKKFLPALLMLIVQSATGQTTTIRNKTGTLALTVNCNNGCRIQAIEVHGRNKLAPAGVYTGFSLPGETYTSMQSTGKIKRSRNGITISGITYGAGALQARETWHFSLKGAAIIWDITRTYSADAILNDDAFPHWNFDHTASWKAGILDNGGVIWCKYLERPQDTYGVHTGGVTFYNDTTGHALRIKTSRSNIAAKYSRNQDGNITLTHLHAPDTLGQRYHLSRFVHGRFDVFAPFKVQKGTVTRRYVIETTDYFADYARGNLPGIDTAAVRELLNTTARYGVVDNNITGANGWLTNWKCLHEPFFAQIGLALGDEDYTRNLSSTLDQERDSALLPDGRVLSRWHDVPGDEIPGTYNASSGYYEAMWGYTIDSQTGHVINTAEQFDLNGDLTWLRAHRDGCRKALEWLIARDSDGNGIFEMKNGNIAEAKASDWLDIVWASYENAFVNAQMYYALQRWAECEQVLGDSAQATRYINIAAKLKAAFNRPVQSGGLWSQEKQQYVYWRDKDGTVHGNNLVTPVNFAAIAFGICDDSSRIAQILDQMETRMQQEKLFHWPLCFDSFERAEVSAGNWPFPKYENGDIFPTWGYLGVRSYVLHNKSIALKYIRQLLSQYNKDGLSFQRYSRTTQTGLGNDILAGSCTSITALYRDIYGVRPKWNRMGLEPNLSAELDGTSFPYRLRGKQYHILLQNNLYALQGDRFTVKSGESFGADRSDNDLIYFHQNKDAQKIKISSKTDIHLQMRNWTNAAIAFQVKAAGRYNIALTGLLPEKTYIVTVNGNKKNVRTNLAGELLISQHATGETSVHVAA